MKKWILKKAINLIIAWLEKNEVKNKLIEKLIDLKERIG